MQQLDKHDIQNFLNKTNFAEVLQKDGHELKRSGQGYLMKCFAHDDGNPSMFVSEGRCKCFACGFKGNLVDYIKLSRGVGFRDAMKQISGLSGVRLPEGFHSGKGKRAEDSMTVDKFLDTIGRWAAQHEKAQILLGSKTLGETGVGYVPATISDPKVVKYLKGMPKRFLELADIHETKDKKFRGPDKYFWRLEERGKTTGCVQFEMGYDNETKKFTRPEGAAEPRVMQMPDSTGAALCRKRDINWHQKRNATVTNDPIDALNAHRNVSRFGPGIYLPLPPQQRLTEETYHTLMRHNKITFVARRSMDCATFGLRVLQRLRDTDKVMIIQHGERKIQPLSEYLIHYMRTATHGRKHGELFERALLRNKNAPFYRELLGRELAKELDRFREKEPPQEER